MPNNRKRKVRFHTQPLHARKKDRHALEYLSEKYSFWVATLSIFSFVVGNMVGQHGWFVVWKSVFGQNAHQIELAYTGTVTPIEKVPNYVKWASYGGNPHTHTYRQVPLNVLTTLPPYDASTQNNHKEVSKIGQIYSVGYSGSYANGGEGDGSHPGVDIRVPIGTPVRSIANGIVEFAGFKNGFGKTIVVKHPNAPDPSNPLQTTTLYSSYAHLSSILVGEGDVLQIGERIGLSGNTGWSTGPHLHFQIDRDDVAYHPYWPFTNTEARNRGMTLTQAVNSTEFSSRVYANTVHPMYYVQANYQPVTYVARANRELHAAASTRSIVASSSQRSEVAVTPSRPRTITAPRVSRQSRARSRREERIQERLSARRFNRQDTAVAPPNPIVVSKQEVVTASAENEILLPTVATQVEIEHDGRFTSRMWDTIYVRLLDSNGNPVSGLSLERDVHMRTAFGSAEFDPPILSSDDFVQGVATVKMLPRGRRTIVILAQPFGSLSKPMQFNR